MAGPIVGYIVGKIGDFLIEEAPLLKDADKEVRRLRDELQTMEIFLEDADMRWNSNPLVKDWVKKVREAGYEADDLLELFALEEENRRVI